MELNILQTSPSHCFHISDALFFYSHGHPSFTSPSLPYCFQMSFTYAYFSLPATPPPSRFRPPLFILNMASKPVFPHHTQSIIPIFTSLAQHAAYLVLWIRLYWNTIIRILYWPQLLLLYNSRDD